MLEPLVGATYITTSSGCQSFLWSFDLVRETKQTAPMFMLHLLTNAQAEEKLPHRFPLANQKTCF